MIKLIFSFLLLFSNIAQAQLANGTVDVNVLGGTLSLTGTSAVTQSGPWAISVSNFPATQPVSGTVGVSSLPALPAGSNAIGSVSVSNFPSTQNVSVTNGSLAVTGPLTDTQLRASAVPVSLASVPTHPVTQSGVWNVGADTELTAPATLADAAANPTISNIASYLLGFNGTSWDRLRSTTANGLVVDVSRVQGSVAVTGPLTDAQLRATAVPVSGTVTANAGTGTFQTNVTNASIAVTGPLTDTQLRASAVPVSGTLTANLGTIAGVATETTLSAINNKTPALISGRVPVDGSGVTQPISAASLPLPAGAAQDRTTATSPSASRLSDGADFLAAFDLDNTAGISKNLGVTIRGLANGAPVELGTASNPFRVDPTGSTTQPISAASLPLPANASTLTEQQSQTTLLNTIATNTGAQSTDLLQTGSITALNGVVSINAQGAYTVSARIAGTWVATLIAEGLMADGSTWQQLPLYVVQTTLPYPSTFTVTTNANVLITGGGYTQIRIRASAFTSGTVTVNLNASLAQQTIFASQLGNWTNTIQGQFNTSLPTLTSGNSSILQSDNRGRLLVNTDRQRRTYSAAVQALTAAGNPTDVFTITGSATATVFVKKIEISGVATANTVGVVQLIKRSTANTAGTSTTPAAVPMDSNDAAATAVVRAYTANPTLGTAVGTIAAKRIFYPITAATLPSDNNTVFEFGTDSRQSLILRGATQVLSLNLNGTTIGGNSLSIYVEWEEE